MNLSPRQNGVHEEYLKIGDLISVFASWQQDGVDHVVKYSVDHGQAMSQWFTHPMGIFKFAHPLNGLSRLETRHNGPSLGLIHPKSNWSNIKNATDALRV